MMCAMNSAFRTAAKEGIASPQSTSHIFFQLKRAKIMLLILSMLFFQLGAMSANAQARNSSCDFSICDAKNRMLIFNKINDAYIINMKIKGNFLRVLEASKKELLQTCVRQAVIVLVPEALAKVSGMTLVVEYINNNANAKKFQQSLSEEIQIALEALETTKTTYRNLQRLCNSEPLASAILTDAIANLEQAKALVTLSFELMQ